MLTNTDTETSKNIITESNCKINPKGVGDKFDVDDEEELIDNDLVGDIYEDEIEEKNNKVDEVPLFDGKTSMTAQLQIPAKRFDISAEVSAVCGKGTLISASGVRDHLWLGFVEDKVLLRFDAGSGPFELRAGRVNIDGRSKISARRYKKDALLQIGAATAMGTAKGKFTSLDTGPSVYIGLSPDNITKLSGTSGISGFIGCIHRLRVSGVDIIPPARDISVSSSGVRSCTPENLARLVCP